MCIIDFTHCVQFCLENDLLPCVTETHNPIQTKNALPCKLYNALTFNKSHLWLSEKWYSFCSGHPRLVTAFCVHYSLFRLLTLSKTVKSLKYHFLTEMDFTSESRLAREQHSYIYFDFKRSFLLLRLFALLTIDIFTYQIPRP